MPLGNAKRVCVLDVGSQFLDGDGRFPNHIPNPENKQAMEAGCRMVLDHGADLGVVFDTDVDRSAVVAADGEPINSNRYIALMAYIALRYALHRANSHICPLLDNLYSHQQMDPNPSGQVLLLNQDWLH